MQHVKFKPILIALAGLALIVLVLVAIKGSQIFVLMNSSAFFAPPPASVSTFAVEAQKWPQVYQAVGTVEADEGIMLAAEMSGKVQHIAFKSGQFVKAGTILLEQESANERAQLDAANARLRLAQSHYNRLQQLLKEKLVSQSDVDNGLQQLESTQGDVDNLSASLRKKVVRAPFDGRLGIRQVALGQDLLVGTPIVSLQATNRVRVNIPVSQAWLLRMEKGLNVHLHLDDLSQTVLRSEIMALSADINIKTRSATVQTSLNNVQQKLIPGMAINAEIELSAPQSLLVVPATAIIFASYGDTVFVVETDPKDKSSKVRQQFVQLGKSRGDFVEIIKGLNEGDVVVSAGGFKLMSGMPVVINNEQKPPYLTAPTPADT